MSQVYAVTGASGHLGRLVVTELLARGVEPHQVVAIARTPGTLDDLAERGVQVREGDYDRPETLNTALAGVSRLLLVSGSEIGRRVPQHTAVIEAAKAAGVGRIAYTSVLKAGSTSNPVAPEHVESEKVLRASGVPHTILRNSWYLEVYTDQAAQYLATGRILGATGGAPVSGAPRADYAAAAASALLENVDGNQVYELGGPAFTLADLAAAITEATGTTVVYEDLAPEAYRSALTGAGLDEGTVRFLVGLDASIAAGELATDSDDLRRLLGREPAALGEAVKTLLG
ncbi:SDR family oxidoreductase [Myceligenerans pegani]|uniref:SDR family oxidoreductase n=1 Tax=Myceligenerans pegani TaxID=2776917 RepID=A0ABR9N136_9MICO|nr:SDR family oxidoreductase [Myceligenerans sp. TRM 65318]MBE1877339.1 SDR family oxidoreductase [Myceligenerans sp. TRM 65318]MBE3019610.1 SDR family oxidoreductase [Myceligenerans sp. TRM 65318]